MAGRPPKPTNLLQLTGAHKKNPKRAAARAGEPTPDGPLGDPPSRWSAVFPEFDYQRCGELRELWREVQEMAPWLTSADRWTVESICELKLLERRRAIKPGERSELGRLSGKCGLNPSDRVKVNVAPNTPKTSDPRDVFERGAKHG
ncbi:MAG TPA: hypothetical protein VM554_15105 [Acidisarcina sp.]|nr:hypothetical protein [Acidisarcina sp.]